MAKDLNKVQLTGRLGMEPEMRFTPQGSAVTTFRVACNRSWKGADGASHEDTEWFSIVAWNKLAEICNEYLSKGSRVYIEGRLQTRSWDDAATGDKRYKTEVIANDLIILDNRRGTAASPAGEEFVGDEEAFAADEEIFPEEDVSAAPATPPVRAPQGVRPTASAAMQRSATPQPPRQPAPPKRGTVTMEEVDIPDSRKPRR